jgi:hypothetical protein
MPLLLRPDGCAAAVGRESNMPSCVLLVVDFDAKKASRRGDRGPPWTMGEKDGDKGE